jgi:hypothetical protein
MKHIAEAYEDESNKRHHCVHQEKDTILAELQKKGGGEEKNAKKKWM